MEQVPPVRIVAAAADRVCHLLWLLQRQEPEVRELAERRGALGFPHYLTSRLGVISPELWVAAVFISPASLVEHLLPRCLALDPPSYVDLSLDAAGAALRRLLPGVPPQGLRLLAAATEPEGVLPLAWAKWPRTGDPWRDLIRDAMVVREDRAHGHYRAGAEQGLGPVQLLILTSAWRGRAPSWIAENFKWPEPEVAAGVDSLLDRGWLAHDGSLTAAGQAARQAIEDRTDQLAARSLQRSSGASTAPALLGLEALAKL